MTKEVPLKVIHVDDDPGFIKYFRKLLEGLSDIVFIESFSSAPEVLRYLEHNTVDIIFIDVEMPGHNGIWLAKQVMGKVLNIVFVTGHAHYAVQAFEVCALDYLQKPAGVDRVRAVIDRVQRQLSEKNNRQAEQIDAIYRYLDPEKRPDRIFINMVGSISVVRLQDIVYFSSKNTYTLITLKNGDRLTASKTIKTYEDALVHHPGFFRASRFFIVNADFIRSIQRNSNTRRITIAMDNGEILETSFKTKEEIMRRIS